MIPRILIHNLVSALRQFPVVGLIGSRQSGKTTLARSLLQTMDSAYLDLELPSDQAKLTEPEIYLQEHTDRLVILDEIQRVPDLFPILRGLVDQNRQPGRFLILGSAGPERFRRIGVITTKTGLR